MSGAAAKMVPVELYAYALLTTMSLSDWISRSPIPGVPGPHCTFTQFVPCSRIAAGTPHSVTLVMLDPSPIRPFVIITAFPPAASPLRGFTENALMRFVTAVAAFQFPSPLCRASTSTSPVPLNVRFVPLTRPGPETTANSVTGSPELAVAPNATTAFVSRGCRAGNVML
ncbi:MAG: hypothetical protein BWY59_00187 [Verrucomicrobia bacterium ADurb.Bin345]|nr:MAG: hypothetical protein BWY59_00187 [Verrucomicrobia bacterium ADurb.Bin345]